MSARHTLDLLGETLRDLAPLVAAAVQALDKPGTRALRRKLDGEFHYALGHYGTLRRMETPESQWDALRLTLPRYDRATEVWPGRASFEARKACEASAKEPAPTPSPACVLRLVVDNGRPVEAVERVTLGGAA
ncbi:hypothetical protein [Reyranella sp.]|jgi:hypothetical protein|uniref:hypothetical protein n=1 Tax=Reyranella sp. TaxID=1929291 RepID=UPI000BC5430C|nr:hypothetical protein [Reyranella sp.]OYZ90446.1 MAG: hypothetical protein B7Y08_29830 [Rhodospirillales bacterium 24-66-33]